MNIKIIVIGKNKMGDKVLNILQIIYEYVFYKKLKGHYLTFNTGVETNYLCMSLTKD